MQMDPPQRGLGGRALQLQILLTILFASSVLLVASAMFLVIFRLTDKMHTNMFMKLVIKAARKKPLILLALCFGLQASMITGYHHAVKNSSSKKCYMENKLNNT